MLVLGLSCNLRLIRLCKETGHFETHSGECPGKLSAVISQRLGADEAGTSGIRKGFVVLYLPLEERACVGGF